MEFQYKKIHKIKFISGIWYAQSPKVCFTLMKNNGTNSSPKKSIFNIKIKAQRQPFHYYFQSTLTSASVYKQSYGYNQLITSATSFITDLG